tara:strand:+ start:1980 stop:2414 length:435 start_codon:yes stop_codon:yes gene_type:complete
MVRRRKAKKSPTKYKSAFNVRQVGKSYVQLGIGTELLFSTSPIEFFAGGLLPGYAGTSQGQRNITAYELFNWTAGKAYATGDSAMSYGSGIGDTVMNNVKSGAGRAVVSTVGLKVADKGLQKLGFYRSFNKLVRSAGLGDLIKM